MDFEREAEKITEIELSLKVIRTNLKESKQALREASESLQHAQHAQEILQLVSKAVQQRAHEKISEVVSRCLSAVFDDPYEFKIEFEMKRGRTEARLRFLRRGLDVDPLSSTSGGVVDVAAFALRVACLVLHRPRLRPVIMLDEPFKFVSAQYRHNVKEMLESLAKDLQIQIILVTHIDEIATGKIIRL